MSTGRFYIVLSLLWVSFWSVGCSVEDELLPKQKEQFVSYLGNTHNPRLLSEEEWRISLDEDPPFYTETGNTVYRYISNYYQAGRDSRTVIEYGDKATITFSMYLFDFRNIGDSDMPYLSNDSKLEEKFAEAGLTINGGVWDFKPLEVELGVAKLIEGFELALLGSREGDIVEAYMTFTMGYGDNPMYAIPKESAIAIFFTVDKVVKQ